MTHFRTHAVVAAIVLALYLPASIGWAVGR